MEKKVEVHGYAYSLPDPSWVAEYLADTRGKLYPNPVWWWAFSEVADRYQLHPNTRTGATAMAKHETELRELFAAYKGQGLN
jgi:hypothetical protein